MHGTDQGPHDRLLLQGSRLLNEVLSHLSRVVPWRGLVCSKTIYRTCKRPFCDRRGGIICPVLHKRQMFSGAPPLQISATYTQPFWRCNLPATHLQQCVSDLSHVNRHSAAMPLPACCSWKAREVHAFLGKLEKCTLGPHAENEC